MGRLFRTVGFAIVLIGLAVGFTGCSSTSPTAGTTFPTPTTISLSPTPEVSIDLGKIQAFTATPKNKTGGTITTPVSFQSNNTAVVTIANNGVACAGTWDSLSAPTVCTPGAVGSAQIVATSKGVFSPPATVYVHQHIDNIQISPVANQTIPPSFVDFNCLSKDTTLNFEATAFNRGVDITATVGTFTWQSLTTAVGTVNNKITGLNPNQVQITAVAPGVTTVFASASSVTSVPMAFETCRVASITLAVDGTDNNSVTVTKGTVVTVTPTVTDIADTVITKVPLTWCSSDPEVAAASPNCTTSSIVSPIPIATPGAGGASIVASCTPPACNIGFQPSLPVYASTPVAVTSTTTAVTATTTAWVSSTSCGTTDGCITVAVPIAVPANTVGTRVVLPATPNSFVFNKTGTAAFLGTNFNLLGTKGLMTLDTSTTSATLSEVISTWGKVLAVSPDGKKVILTGTTSNSDPTPNQFFIYDTGTRTSQIVPIAGATAAAFSPDALKAYIVAGTTLYVFSTLDSPQTLTMAAPANDVAFLSQGSLAYFAGGASSAITTRATCDNSLIGPATRNTPATPLAIRPLLDRKIPGDDPDKEVARTLALDPPGIDLITATFDDSFPCPPVFTNTGPVTFNLGHGNFVPKQMVVSTDTKKVYIVAEGLADILVFDTESRTSSSIALSGGTTLGNPIPLSATLTLDGSLLYVGADDGLDSDGVTEHYSVHVVDTNLALDTAQVPIVFIQNSKKNSLCFVSTGDAADVACQPDLIAIKP